LLKKGRGWTRSQDCQHAFEALKKAIIEELIPSLPDLSKPFELPTDGFDLAIGRVLIQEAHPIAFERQKPNDTERRYTIQEREMTAVIHYLCTWRHYLLESKLIKTDNVAISYFQTQKKLTPKQAH